MVLFLGESDVEELLTMKEAIEVLEGMFAEQGGGGGVINHPRHRVKNRRSMLHYMAGAVPTMGVMGLRAYTSSKEGIKFRVFLHDIDSGALLAIMDGNYMGMIRTGAVSGVATKYMAREEAATVGIFGTGWQARGQLMAMREVRELTRVRAYGRDQGRRETFAREMQGVLGCEVVAVGTPAEVLEGADIIITATTAARPLFDGDALGPGVHINAIGGNFLYKKEVDEKTVRKSDIIVLESREQSRMEAGELLSLVDKGRLVWEDTAELGEVVAGRCSGRDGPGQITLFKSLGTAVEDISIAARVYAAARERGMGTELDMPEL